MKEILPVILRGCVRAREIEANLSRMSNQPHLLSDACKAVAADFSNAVDMLSSDHVWPLRAHAVFGEASGSGQHLGGGAAAAREEDSFGSDYMRAMDLLHTRAIDDEIPFFARLPESDVGPSELPELGLEMPTTSTLGVMEFGAGSRGHMGGTVVDHFAGGSRRAPAAGEASDSGRRSEGPSVQRSTTRKRKGSGRTWTRRLPAPRTGHIEIPPDDGYAWRKYGQKVIHGRRFPRSYFRCTHKNIYGCVAKKHAQRLDEDPYTYEVTYSGDHTCRTSPTPYPITANNTGPNGSDPASTSALARLHHSTMPMQLGSWFPGDGEGQKVGKSHVNFHVGERSTAPTSSPQGHGGRDVECLVADMADVMFNSRGTASSMDAIFPSKHGN